MKEVRNFREYFKQEYVLGWKNKWSFAMSIPGLSRSNRNCEGFNDIKDDFKTTKDCHCMNLFLFLWKLSKISEQCNAQNLPFPNVERLTNFKQT